MMQHDASRATENAAPAPLRDLVILPCEFVPGAWAPRCRGVVVAYKQDRSQPQAHTPFLTVTEAKAWARLWMSTRYPHRSDDVAAVLAKLHAEYPDALEDRKFQTR